MSVVVPKTIDVFVAKSAATPTVHCWVVVVQEPRCCSYFCDGMLGAVVVIFQASELLKQISVCLPH